jgi:hypothetical protein
MKTEYIIVCEEMVWIFYNEEYNSRGFRELLGKEARAFIEALKETTKEETPS